MYYAVQEKVEASRHAGVRFRPVEWVEGGAIVLKMRDLLRDAYLVTDVEDVEQLRSGSAGRGEHNMVKGDRRRALGVSDLPHIAFCRSRLREDQGGPSTRETTRIEINARHFIGDSLSAGAVPLPERSAEGSQRACPKRRPECTQSRSRRASLSAQVALQRAALQGLPLPLSNGSPTGRLAVARPTVKFSAPWPRPFLVA